MVIRSVVTDARPATVFLQEIGRIGHAFHTASDDQVDRASSQSFGTHDNRLHARTAHLVDRGRLHRFGQTGLDRGLTRRCLTQTRWQHATHIDALDIIRIDARTFDRCPDRRSAQIRCGNVGEHALHATHRGTRVGQDDDGIGGGHGSGSLVEFDAV